MVMAKGRVRWLREDADEMCVSRAGAGVPGPHGAILYQVTAVKSGMHIKKGAECSTLESLHSKAGPLRLDTRW